MQLNKWIIQLIVSISLFTLPLVSHTTVISKTGASTETTVSFKQKLEDAVENWKSEVSKDEQFASFAEARWEVQVLGPGQRSFLVLFYDNNNLQSGVIGYLILHQSETGALVVGEYGKGLYVSLDYLAQSPSSTLYYHPFEAIYINEQLEPVDLYTNETYPLDKSHYTQQNNVVALFSTEQNVINTTSTLHSSLHRTYFSAYDAMPWLTTPSINDELIDDRSIETDIELESSLYFRVKTWSNTIGTVFSVTSLHKWNTNYDMIGLQLDDEFTIRYIPLSQLLSLGHFYSS